MKQKLDIPQDEIATFTRTEIDMTEAEAVETIDSIAVVDTTESEAQALTTDTEVETLEGEAQAPTTDTTAEIEEQVEINLYLHDGTERPINRLLDKELPKIFDSGKQKQHTVKNILLTDWWIYFFLSFYF